MYATDGRTKATLNAPFPTSWAIIILYICNKRKQNADKEEMYNWLAAWHMID